MKKIAIILTFLVSTPLFATDTFTKTKWTPFTNGTSISFSDSVTITFNKNTKYRYSFRGFAKTKIDGQTNFYTFEIDCENHTIGLWAQGNEYSIAYEYLNPAHPVWAFRSSFCRVNK
jgi:hypothetical protein